MRSTGSVIFACIAITAFTGCDQTDTGSTSLHLVIDAGSSGTRLCLYPVQHEPSGATACRAPRTAASLEQPNCERLPGTGGLAGLSPARAADRLARGLRGPFITAARGRIRSAALLATGGMRALAAEERQLRMQSLRAALGLAFADQAPGATGTPEIASVRAMVLSGREEARLAWRSVAERYGTQSHAILETGGASVQIACGRAGGPIHASSLPLGMNAAFDRMQAAVESGEITEQDFARCFPFGKSDARTDFAGCRALIRRVLFATPVRSIDPDARNCAKFAQMTPSAPPLYALGSSWKAIFRGMRTLSLSSVELRRFGTRACAMRRITAQERTSPYLQRRCWLYAYQSVLLDESGYDRVRRGADSWPRGAAVDGTYAPDCPAMRR